MQLSKKKLRKGEKSLSVQTTKWSKNNLNRFHPQSECVYITSTNNKDLDFDATLFKALSKIFLHFTSLFLYLKRHEEDRPDPLFSPFGHHAR